MKRIYSTPQTSALTVQMGNVLMASGNGGRQVNSNLGVGITPVPLDPYNAW